MCNDFPVYVKQDWNFFDRKIALGVFFYKYKGTFFRSWSIPTSLLLEDEKKNNEMMLFLWFYRVYQMRAWNYFEKNLSVFFSLYLISAGN
jgi:hypothetical protein